MSPASDVPHSRCLVKNVKSKVGCYLKWDKAGVKSVSILDGEDYHNVLHGFEKHGEHYAIVSSPYAQQYLGIEGGHLKWQAKPYDWTLIAETSDPVSLTLNIGNGEYWLFADDTLGEIVLKKNTLQGGWRLIPNE